MKENHPLLVIIVGPTAVGKTEIAVQLAQHLEGEIVSADSRLFYTGMDIGTAKPTSEQRAAVPHHLVDVAAPDQVWSLAVFQAEAHRAIQDIQARGKLPFLVGGTGQYVRAVTEGWEVPKVKPNPGLRKALEKWAVEVTARGLHVRLASLDPEAAHRIQPENVRRTIRALEVILSSGQLFSTQQQRGFSHYQTLILGLTRPRTELYTRIDARVEAMLASGLVEEVRHLLEVGFSPDLPTLSAIGYREIIAYLQGKLTLEEAAAQIKRQTRVFVRRQANWFKPNDAAIRWFRAGPETIPEIEEAIRSWIETDRGS